MARTTIPSYDAFSTRAREISQAIPKEFLEGIEDVVVHRETKSHPLLEDVLTLGEQEPSAMVAMTGADMVRSIVHLYYGSFVALARQDPRFDVEAELRETIEHEIQHHIEDRAGLRTLVDEDDLFDAHERFRAGMETPRGWWRRGEEVDEGVYRVGDDLFVELTLRRRELERARGTTLTLEVLDEPFEAPVPADARPGEILKFEGEGVLADDPPDEPDPNGADDGGAEGDEAPLAGDLFLVLDVRR